MPDETLYTAVATARDGREGHIRSDDGVLEADLAVPKQMGGLGAEQTNPEQLFAAGYAACFEGAGRLVASKAGVEVGPETQVTARVGIGPRQADGFELSVALDVHLDGIAEDRAEELAMTAHDQICPYSHATRGNVDVDIRIV